MSWPPLGRATRYQTFKSSSPISGAFRLRRTILHPLDSYRVRPVNQNLFVRFAFKNYEIHGLEKSHASEGAGSSSRPRGRVRETLRRSFLRIWCCRSICCAQSCDPSSRDRRPTVQCDSNERGRRSKKESCVEAFMESLASACHEALQVLSRSKLCQTHSDRC